MSLYDWMQEKVFHTYETWRLKSSIYNRTGFHIVAIEKQLRAMRDGVNMYVAVSAARDTGLYVYEGDARAAARSGESDARDGWKNVWDHRS